MKKNRHLAFILLLSLVSIPAAAADFLFQVPVKLEKIPKGIAQAKIKCDVFTYRDNSTPVATGYTIRPINLRNGNLHQEVDVSVNFLNQYRHLKPHQYRCQLLLLTPWATPSWQTPAADSSISVLQPREHSQLVTIVEGLIR